MSESAFVVCPFTGGDHFITGNDECPDCGRVHKSYRYIKGKRSIGIENKICGLIGVTGKPFPRIENGFGGSFCQSIVF